MGTRIHQTVEQLINNVVNPNKQSFTFVGDGGPFGEDSNQWDIGFKKGYDFTLAHYTVEKGYDCEWPKGWGDGWQGNGFAEGTITGRHHVEKRDHPDLVSLNGNSGEPVIEYKDGRIKQYHPKFDAWLDINVSSVPKSYVDKEKNRNDIVWWQDDDKKVLIGYKDKSVRVFKII